MSDGENARLEIPVTRDPFFRRVVADETVVFDLGRDFEISFIQTGREVTSKVVIHNDDQDEGFETDPIFTEVCHIRIPPRTGLILSLQILETMAKSGRLQKDPMSEAFKRISDFISDGEGPEG